MLHGHPSIWVGESDDPLDPTLYKTIADLKNPPQVPHVANIAPMYQPLRMAMNTKEYATTKMEGFVKE